MDDAKRTTRAPAKLNLFLDVLGRRGDGFHDVETLMVPICLADTLSFAPQLSPERGVTAEIRFKFQMAGPAGFEQAAASIPAGPQNLVVRALELLRQASGCRLGAQVELVKRIPAAAGLGGGSSDAAAALRLANRGWGLNWSVERLADVAAHIGSDVPFFLSHGAAVCQGRGERVERLPAMKRIHFVVVKPPVGLNTGEVYRAFAAKSQVAENHATGVGQLVELVHRVGRERILNWHKMLRNCLQDAASSLTPWIERLKAAFDELGFLGHQLSGSGSAYFGVCRHAQHARRLATILRTRQLGLVYATCSCH